MTFLKQKAIRTLKLASRQELERLLRDPTAVEELIRYRIRHGLATIDDLFLAVSKNPTPPLRAQLIERVRTHIKNQVTKILGRSPSSEILLRSEAIHFFPNGYTGEPYFSSPYFVFSVVGTQQADSPITLFLSLVQGASGHVFSPSIEPVSQKEIEDWLKHSFQRIIRFIRLSE